MKPDAVLAPVSWRRMIRAVEKIRERLLRAVKALEEANLPYAGALLNLAEDTRDVAHGVHCKCLLRHAQNKTNAKPS
jgi:cellobiose-specific phosphotransferase system component IIA